MDANPFFSGNSLSFGITGDGVAIDPATGLVTLAEASLLSGAAVLVTSSRAGERAEARFAFRTLPAAAEPVLRLSPTLSGGGRVGDELTVNPGVWDGEPVPALALQWLRDGAPVAGATGTRFVLRHVDNGALIACRVTATNEIGQAVAETEEIAVSYAPPRVVAAQPDVGLVLGAEGETKVLPLAASFAGVALRFTVTGADATIDATTGALTLPVGAERTAEAVVVSAENPGGAVAMRFTVTVQSLPKAEAAPDTMIFVQGPGAEIVQTEGFFSGPGLVFELVGAPAGVTISAATGAMTVPVTTPRRAGFQIRARNAVGAVLQPVTLAVLAPPVTVADPALVVFAQGALAPSMATQTFFSGSELVYTLPDAPAGVTIEADTGIIRLPTNAPMAVVVTVWATNAVGATTETFALRVLRRPAALGALPRVSFARQTGASTVATRTFFTGTDLVYAIASAPAGVTVDPVTGIVSVPTAALLSGAVVVSASNEVGSATQSFGVLVIEPPVAKGAPAPAVVPQGTSGTVDMRPFFAGSDLAFTLVTPPAGVAIDPAVGLVTIAGTAPLSASVTVRASNAAGSADQALAVVVAGVPAATGTPVRALYARGGAPGKVAMKPFFTGADLVFALAAAPVGVTIDAATGIVTIPTAAPLAGRVRVQAVNAFGAAQQGFPVKVLTPPVALAAPAPAAFVQGVAATISGQAFFDGDELAFALVTPPAGATVNAASGLVTLPSGAALSANVTLRASNVAGAVERTVAVTVSAGAAQATTGFETAAALADVSWLTVTSAPEWTQPEAGLGRAVPAVSDRAHGIWSRARGDGRYRCRIRASQITSTTGEIRPFGFNGRMTKDGANFRGLRAEAVLGSDGQPTLQLREYTGAGIASVTLASAPNAWTWGAWHWLEMEFAGATARARLWPEEAAVPAWQVTATSTVPDAGGFGPCTFATGTRRPNVDIGRLEFHGAAQAPAAPLAGDWTLDQIMVQK